LWWSWFGKSQDSLNYSGAHLHSFWVSNTRNFYICILVFFFLCVTFLTRSSSWDCQLVSLYWFTALSQLFSTHGPLIYYLCF
jgi:hypothetical protein